MDQGDTILVDSLNSYRRVSLGKLIVAQQVKQFPASYGPSAITVLKRPPQKYALSQMNQVYAITGHSLVSRLRRIFQVVSFVRFFLTKLLY
jgi:hypothetical protein